MTWEHTAIIFLSASTLFFAFLAWLNGRERKEYLEKYLNSNDDYKALSKRFWGLWKQLENKEMRREVEGE